MSKLIDLTGQRFGQLTVIERVPQKSKDRNSLWVCQCDCGKKRIVRGTNLRRGYIQSCGCMRSTAKENFDLCVSESRLYKIWQKMRARCNQPTNVAYKDYGGRGIHVCDEWEHSFENFSKWAESSGYTETLTIDRIDVNGNYTPENCRWSTRKEQSRNRRTTRYLTYQGVTMPLWKWAEIKNIPLSLLAGRILRGWSPERAFNEPLHVRHKNRKRNNSA